MVSKLVFNSIKVQNLYCAFDGGGRVQPNQGHPNHLAKWNIYVSVQSSFGSLSDVIDLVYHSPRGQGQWGEATTAIHTTAINSDYPTSDAYRPSDSSEAIVNYFRNFNPYYFHSYCSPWKPLLHRWCFHFIRFFGSWEVHRDNRDSLVPSNHHHRHAPWVHQTQSPRPEPLQSTGITTVIHETTVTSPCNKCDGHDTIPASTEVGTKDITQIWTTTRNRHEPTIRAPRHQPWPQWLKLVLERDLNGYGNDSGSVSGPQRSLLLPLQYSRRFPPLVLV